MFYVDITLTRVQKGYLPISNLGHGWHRLPGISWWFPGENIYNLAKQGLPSGKLT